jgi:hypothetical protein
MSNKRYLVLFIAVLIWLIGEPANVSPNLTQALFPGGVLSVGGAIALVVAGFIALVTIVTAVILLLGGDE